MPNPVPGSKLTVHPRGLVERIAQGMTGITGMWKPNTASAGQADRAEPWMGPGRALTPMAPAVDAAGRALDYQYGFNTSVAPRQFEGVSFAQLRGLVESLDQCKLAIETCKDQMSSLTWGIKPRMGAGNDVRPAPDARCATIEEFLRYPDRKHSWDAWNRKLDDEQLVIDAASIYIRRDNSGKPYGFEIIDGATIVPKLDIYGTTPDFPAVAFQQIIKGMPAVDYTTNDLIYAPRNPRAHKVYGYSAVEQIILTINIAVRREIAKLGYFVDGNIPDAVCAVPKEWTVEQIAKWQVLWDTVIANPLSKTGKVKFIPGGMAFTPTRSDQALFGEFDEWLARLICYAFSLPALPFVKQQNRATAESANDAALSAGLAPRMAWRKSVYDRLIKIGFGYDDLEFCWDDVQNVDPDEEIARNLDMIRMGIKSIDEVRAEMGLAGLGMPHAIWGVGPMGFMFVADILKAQAAGQMLPPLAAPPDAMAGGPPQIGPDGQPLPPQPQMIPQTGAPLDGSAPVEDAPGVPGVPGGPGVPASQMQPNLHPLTEQAYAGIPPELLAAVGLGPHGPGGRAVDVTRGEALDSHPDASGAASRKVLATLLTAEKAHNGAHR